MSLTEIDFQILKKQLLEFEKRLEEVENEIKILSAYVDTQLMKKYYPNTAPPNEPVILPKNESRGYLREPIKVAGEIPCYFESLTEKERMKPISVVCYCKRCTPRSTM